MKKTINIVAVRAASEECVFVCICNSVRESEVIEAIQAGARTVGEVGKACGAGTDCGSCCGRIDELIDEHGIAEVRLLRPSQLPLRRAAGAGR